MKQSLNNKIIIFLMISHVIFNNEHNEINSLNCNYTSTKDDIKEKNN